MGAKFKEIALPEAEEALPLRSKARYCKDDDDFMAKKLKNMQKRE